MNTAIDHCNTSITCYTKRFTPEMYYTITTHSSLQWSNQYTCCNKCCNSCCNNRCNNEVPPMRRKRGGKHAGAGAGERSPSRRIRNRHSENYRNTAVRRASTSTRCTWRPVPRTPRRSRTPGKLRAYCSKRSMIRTSGSPCISASGTISLSTATIPAPRDEFLNFGAQNWPRLASL